MAFLARSVSPCRRRTSYVLYAIVDECRHEYADTANHRQWTAKDKKQYSCARPQISFSTTKNCVAMKIERISCNFRWEMILLHFRGLSADDTRWYYIRQKCFEHFDRRRSIASDLVLSIWEYYETSQTQATRILIEHVPNRIAPQQQQWIESTINCQENLY